MKKKKETSATIRERQRQHRIAIMGIAIIAVECIIGIGTIMYFMNTL
tara:strand:+ start:1196 stop:1336 length:141 start_codon:yes stop_codon:yes gene_type:complete